MKSKIVTIRKDEGRAGTKIIADGFERSHDQVKRLVEKYKVQFEKISPLKGDITKGKTKAFREYLLDEDQFIFLGTLFKNDDQTVDFKLRVIQEFKKCRKTLSAASKQKNDPVWNEIRVSSKKMRLSETDEIKKFIAYAKSQGGTPRGCDMYYSNFTRMMNYLLFIFEGEFKALRNLLSANQLMTISVAENIISKAIKEGIENNVFYKDIYKDVKSKVAIFSELHGKTKVIDSILIEEETQS